MPANDLMICFFRKCKLPFKLVLSQTGQISGSEGGGGGGSLTQRHGPGPYPIVWQLFSFLTKTRNTCYMVTLFIDKDNNISLFVLEVLS